MLPGPARRIATGSSTTNPDEPDPDRGGGGPEHLVVGAPPQVATLEGTNEPGAATPSVRVGPACGGRTLTAAHGMRRVRTEAAFPDFEAFRLLAAEVQELTPDFEFMVRAAALNGLHLGMETPSGRQREAALLAEAAQKLRPVLEMWMEGLVTGPD
jgi:hypothetical protein